MRFPEARLVRPFLLVTTLAVAGALAAACNTPPSGRATGAGATLHVVAAENVWGSIASQLGGSHVDVVNIIDNPGTDPHDYEPTAGDGRTVAGADLLIVNGTGYDAWASRLAQANGSSANKLLDIASLVGVRAGGNPHMWYDPRAVERVADDITRRYKQLDRAHAADYDRQRADFQRTALGRYRQLIADIKAMYAGTPIGVSESIFAPMTAATGLTLATPPGFYDAVAEGTDPTAGDKETVDRQVKTGQIKVWVFNSQNATPDVQRITDAARAKHIPVVTVTETLTPANASFQQWQVAQLQSLQQALHTATGK